MNFIKKVTGTGGGEQPGEAPTPTPAPTGAPDPTPAADTTPAPAAGVGGLVGAIKNAVTGGGSPSGGDTAAVPVTSTTDEAPPADAAPGVLGNLTSSISSAAHTVTDAATSTISSAAHSVTGAASGIMGHKKDAGDAAVPAAGDGAAAEKEGGIGGFLHSVTDAAKGAAQAVKDEIQADIKPSLKEDGATAADAAATTPAAPKK